MLRRSVLVGLGIYSASLLASPAGAEPRTMITCEKHSPPGSWVILNHLQTDAEGDYIPVNPSGPSYIRCAPDVDGQPMILTTRIVEIPTGTSGGGSEPTVSTVTFENSDLLFSYGFSAVLIFWAVGVGMGAVLSLVDNRNR